MPKRTFITQENKMPGHKPKKDRHGNACGDLKVKPLLVDHSEPPVHVFKKYKVQKERLSVMCEKILLDKDLPLKAILLMDNAPAHPPGLEEDLLEEFQFIWILFLPPNTTPLIQPMDQQLISNFKKLYMKEMFRRCLDMTDGSGSTLADYWKHQFDIVGCLQLIKTAREGVSQRNLNACWRNLWPDCVVSPGNSTQQSAVVEIVSLGRTMGLEVSEEDVTELVEIGSIDLSTKGLLALQQEQQQGSCLLHF
ncbi:hypothetical protein JRQ81_001257 [Phrynocephalus forsythii]|uniref:DDE-1 domain-containing protein n=1 Tax=Phrynocephalus forsythii TaxID=171643 RepID=A0A9Q0Y7H2_9SAUR|nr:hypothetical protein JRQ81_001257 [Phrynocephalus forsythii]